MAINCYTYTNANSSHIHKPGGPTNCQYYNRTPTPTPRHRTPRVNKCTGVRCSASTSKAFLRSFQGPTSRSPLPLIALNVTPYITRALHSAFAPITSTKPKRHTDANLCLVLRCNTCARPYISIYVPIHSYHITTVFLPRSKDQLQRAVSNCLKFSASGACTTGSSGAICAWDVSQITDLSGTFYKADSFNADVSKWDVSHVTDMTQTFDGAISFTVDLSKWDVSRVSNMLGMFDGASSFNADLSKWDVSQVTDMRRMFRGAGSFRADLSEWDVSRVTGMDYMFHAAKSFNVDISEWNVSRVTSMNGMFLDAEAFTQILDGNAWIHSMAKKTDMFWRSSGSLVCGAWSFAMISCHPATRLRNRACI